MTKKKSPPLAEDMMTSAAKAIGSTLGRLAVAAGLEHAAAPTSTMAPARKKNVRKPVVRKTPAKKSLPAKKTAMVKKSVGRPMSKKKRAK